MQLISFIASTILGLFIVSQAACQNTGQFVFEGQIKGLKNGKIILNRLQGHKEFKISELQPGSDGKFMIRLDEIPRTGQYRLRIDPAGRNGILEFLFTGENHIRFTTDVDYLLDSIKFEKSDVNLAWYDYFRTKDDFETRLSILEHLLNIYPPDERFRPEVIKEFNLLQDELGQKVGLLVNAHSNTLLARYILSDQSPRINPYLSTEQRQEFIRNNYLNKVDFTDTLLLNTDIFPNKALSYIMLYRNQRLNREEQAREFIRATDNLLPLAMIQPIVYNYLLSYTISGFEQIGLEDVLMHIAENYPVDETCLSDHDTGELQRRMEGYRKLAPGNKAPGISQPDINNQVFELSKVKAQNVLILFWASWCPHCTAMLPDIKALAGQVNSGADVSNRLQVISISIDHEEADFLEYMDKFGLHDKSMKNYWVNLCDFKAWDGKVAEDYYLYATPTMILLDKDGIIAGKPSNVPELINQLGL